MGFYLRVAPGVKVRATSRGLRTSIGPRAARLHMGAGGAGVSTGYGPLTYYKGVNAGSRSSSSPRSASTTSGGSPTGAAKAQEGQRLSAEIQGILDLNHVDFVDASPPVAPPPHPVDEQRIRQTRRAAAKSSTSFWKRAERKAALAEADRLTAEDVAEARTQGKEQMDVHQAELDSWWARLGKCDPHTVMGTIAAAFEDNEAPAAPVGVEGSEVSLVVVVPHEDAVPERKPTLTAAGNLSLKKLTKTETAELYRALVCGHVLLTVREALAVAPSLTAARIVAVRASSPDAYGKREPEVMAALHFTKAKLQGVKWREVDAERIVHDCSDETLMVTRGATKALQPIDLGSEPDVTELLGAVDMQELLEHG